MITSLTWVPRGAARSRPIRYELSPEEIERVKALASEEEEIEKQISQDRANIERNNVDTSELPPELNMDEYDSDHEVDDVDAVKDIEESMDDLVVSEEDGKAYVIENDDDEDDEADNIIMPTDSILIAAVTEDDFSHLEVQIFSDDGNLFIHHDITLPEFPLCLAWTDCPPFLSEGSQKNIGNYIAVGTFDPAIEIWNLDVLDPLEPTAILGGYDKSGKKSKKSKNKLIEGSHEDAVMSLSWNKSYRQAMASGSADTKVKIWDITTQKCYHTFTHHSNKVQSVQFHPSEAWLLASGAFDKTITLIDCRSGALGSNYSVASDLESMAWNPFNKDQLFCSLEDGSVVCIDMRLKEKPLYTFQAHDKTTSSLSFSNQVPGMLATASVDKIVKVWDVLHADSSTAPFLVAYKAVSAGKLFSVQFYPDNPYILATGGDKGVVAIWESDETKEIEERFNSRVLPVTSDYAYSSALPTESDIIAEDAMVTEDTGVQEPVELIQQQKKKKNRLRNKNK